VSGPTGATGPSTFVSYLVESASVGDKPIPVGANKLRGTVVGGGGGGGGAYYDTIYRLGGGGGGSGLRCDFLISDIPADSLYIVTVGTGGTAGANGTSTVGTNGGNGGLTYFNIYSPSVTSYKYTFIAGGGKGGNRAPSGVISGAGGDGFAGGGAGGSDLDPGLVIMGGTGRMLDGYPRDGVAGGDGGGGGLTNSGNNGSRGTSRCIDDKPTQGLIDFLYGFGGAGGGPYGADSNAPLITDGTVTNEPGILGGGGVGGGGYAPPTAGGYGCVELYWSI